MNPTARSGRIDTGSRLAAATADSKSPIWSTTEPPSPRQAFRGTEAAVVEGEDVKAGLIESLRERFETRVLVPPKPWPITTTGRRSAVAVTGEVPATRTPPPNRRRYRCASYRFQRGGGVQFGSA